MFIPERLKQCREELGLSQEDMIIELNKIGLRKSRQTLLNWEKGEDNGGTAPDVNDLQFIANLFKKPIGYFFDQKSK